MRNGLDAAKARTLVITILGATALAATWGLLPRTASAQGRSAGDDGTQTTGFIRLADGETTTCGILLPAVQSARRRMKIEVMDLEGTEIYGGDIAEGSQTAFFDITFIASPTAPGGEIVVRIGGTDSELGRLHTNDGTFIVFVYPGTSRNNKPVVPLATYQVFDSEGTTRAHHRLFYIVDRS